MDFEEYDHEDFDNEIKEYFSEEGKLASAISFLEYRTKELFALYNLSSEDDYEELAIVLYYRLILEEIKDIYEKLDLTKKI